MNNENFEDRISVLEQENIRLKEELVAVNSTLREFCTAFSGIISQVESNIKLFETLSRGINQSSCTANNLKYELNDPKGYEKDFFYPEFRSNEETLRLITEEKKSLARFGDGEFSIAFHIPRQKFQRVDDRLAKRIWEVLNADHPDLLIGIAQQYGCLEQYSEQGAAGIRLYMTEETRKLHRKIIPEGKVYSDAYITRPYVLYKDVFSDAPRKRFEALKKIWMGKKVIVVEGAQTRLGVGNDLFSGMASLERIVAPATSSFDRYEDILRECLKQGYRADLFLLAIGPSSGVLSYDLTVQGFQAVDVGHIDLEYEWFLAGKGCRVPVPYKYNNETEGGDCVEPLQDPVYEASIIASFV